MNPWQFLRHEIGGTVRSLRYDLTTGRDRRRMQQDTMELPIIATYSRKRRRVVITAGTALMAAAGVSGYFAISSSIDALTGGGESPASLPRTTVKPRPSSSPVNPVTPPVVPAAVQQIPNTQPMPAAPGPAKTEATPTLSPPVPTPAPTCTCATPSPSPTVSPSPSPSTSPSTRPSASPSATMAP
jgi:hypothetical protein